jgi:hypothetical protein
LKENEMSANAKQTPIATETIDETRSRRAAALADRIEEGAAGLAAFAEGLSEEEWHTPTSPTDGRSIGVIVNHVASVYPIEIEAARAIASGQAVTEVTWEGIAEMNAKHAQDQTSVTKLRRLNCYAAIVAKRPPQYARSRMSSWTRQRRSL